MENYGVKLSGSIFTLLNKKAEKKTLDRDMFSFSFSEWLKSKEWSFDGSIEDIHEDRSNIYRGNYIERPYFTIGSAVYIGDGAGEMLISTFEEETLASSVCMLLNDAYSGAFKDGRFYGYHNGFQTLHQELIGLSMRNGRLTLELEKFKPKQE